MKIELFRMERVTYREQDVTLLENFNINIYQGEIMGMLPVNSHGLSAFLHLLQTNLPLYDGYVYYCGEMINSWKEERRTNNRISIIGSDNRLVERLSVTDNIFVLRNGFRQEIIREGLLQKQLRPFLEDIGIEIPMKERVEKLTAFERVIVELLRAVVTGHRLIVLQEIGSLVSHEELKKVHEILHHYVDKGYTFLYICSHLEEIAMICGRCAMLSNGHIQNVIQEKELNDEVLRIYPAEYDQMVRHHQEIHADDVQQEQEVLLAEGVSGEYLSNLTFQVHAGECLAVQFMDDLAFHEAAGILTGIRQADAGTIRMNGKSVPLLGNPHIAVIQEMASRTMIFPELDYMENLCMALSQRMPSVWMRKNIRNSIRKEYAPILGEEVFSMSMEELSEKQKYQMIYTRILLQKPQVVFCIQPFKGADLPLRMMVWKLMEILMEHGIGVVILSMNLSDSLSLADRLVVVDRQGQKEILRRDFASIPGWVPWTHIYREK